MIDPRILYPGGITPALRRRMEREAEWLGLKQEDVIAAMDDIEDADSVKKEKDKETKRKIAETQEQLKKAMVAEARRIGTSEDKIRRIAPELAYPKLSAQEKQRLQAVEERLQAIKPEIVDHCEAICNLVIEVHSLINEGRGIVDGKDHPGFSHNDALRYILDGLNVLFYYLPNVFSLGKSAKDLLYELRKKIGLIA